jgi:uncharacterized protein (TIGR04255 family)
MTCLSLRCSERGTIFESRSCPYFQVRRRNTNAHCAIVRRGYIGIHLQTDWKMRAPARPRVVYRRNPLTQVVFQARFPLNLAIEGHLPVKFQRDVMGDFPILEAQEALQFAIMVGGQAVDGNSASRRSTAFNFHDRDQKNTVTLTSEFIAFATTNYHDWTTFRAQVDRAMTALFANYEIPLFTRVGLRFMNSFKPTELGLGADVPSRVFDASLIGPVAGGTDAVDEYQALTVVTLSNGKMAIRVSLTKDESGPTYVLDCDAYNEHTTLADKDETIRLLDAFHSEQSDVFRSAISDAVHDALGVGDDPS